MAASKRPVLVIIYNHHYPENIPKLEKIYAGRFARIYHLVPFYSKQDCQYPEITERIIPVFYQGFFFQGAIAQGFNDYYHDDASHYIFVADDMLINPAINEDNYKTFFRLKEQSSLIGSLAEIPPLSLGPFQGGWYHSPNAYSFNLGLPGLEVIRERLLPSYEEAIKRFEQFGLQTEHIDSASHMGHGLIYRVAYKLIMREYLSNRRFGRCLARLGLFPKYKISYPLVMGYSDICIVPSQLVHKFQQYCGAFAVANLFVEAAIPTSLLLAQEKPQDLLQIRYLPVKHYDGPWDGKHPLAKHKNLKTIQQLMDIFPQDYLYIHPVKLSKIPLS